MSEADEIAEDLAKAKATVADNTKIPEADARRAKAAHQAGGMSFPETSHKVDPSGLHISETVMKIG